MEALIEFLKEKAEGNAISIVNIKGGAAVEMVDLALAKALENCNDINTTMKAREVKLKVTLKPSDDRGVVTILLDVESKLAGQETQTTSAQLAINSRGQAFARELRTKQPPLPVGNVTQINQ